MTGLVNRYPYVCLERSFSHPKSNQFSFEGWLRLLTKCHATLEQGAAGEVVRLLQDWYDLPRRADFLKVVLLSLDRRADPTSKEGIKRRVSGLA
jgi:hypothetical protein